MTLRKAIRAIFTLLIKRQDSMQKQIEQLNGTVANLTQAVTGLQGRIGTIQEPDLSGAIAGIQGATDAINALAQPAAPSPTPVDGVMPTGNGTNGSASPVSSGAV